MFSLQVALKFIRHKKLQAALIILGFAIGISTNIFVGNLIPSIRQDLIDRTVDSRPHVSIISNHPSDLINYSLDISEILDNRNDVTYHFRSIQGRNLIRNINPDFPEDIQIIGVDNFTAANNVYKFLNEDFVGNLPTESNEVIIGTTIAQNLNISVGDRLAVSPSLFMPIQLSKFIFVTGIFDIGLSTPNERWLVGSLFMSEIVFNIEDQVHAIHLQIQDSFDADSFSLELADELGRDDVDVTNWKEENQALLDSMQAQSISIFVVQFFILLAVSIGIASILGITVLQKSQQIGILKAMGLTDRDSALVFVFQGLFYGIGGTIAGFMMSLGMIVAFNHFGGPDIVDITILPVFTSVSMAVSIFAAVLSSISAASRSSKMLVIDILRKV